MTDRETTVTEDLKSAMEILDDPVGMGAGAYQARQIIDKALSKIQNLRCEAVASLDKL